MKLKDKSLIIRKTLLKWHDEHPRLLPWKETKDPYKIWISEIILQQTRVEQGTKYYLDFVENFPDLYSLAGSSLDRVLRAWKGLGYYSRARNLHETAKALIRENQGLFPANYDELIRLKGIGPYTAAAIASFAFGQSNAVVDGNVIRVLTRLFGIEENTTSSKIRRLIQELASACLSRQYPAKYNQAIMNFGAIMCKPRRPDCARCPLNKVCVAFQNGKTDKIPFKKAKGKRKSRHFTFFVILHGKQIVVTQRDSADIWPLLYQLPIWETISFENRDYRPNIYNIFKEKLEFTVSLQKQVYRQALSHQEIHARFAQINTHSALSNDMLNLAYRFEDFKNLRNFAFPKIIDCYLKDNLIYLA